MRLLSPSFHLGRFLIPWILFSLSCAFPVPRHPPHSHLHRTHTTITSQHKLKEDPDVPDFWYKILAIVLLVLLGGLFAGLTLGLLSLDLISLEVLSQSGNAKEQRYATLIKPIRAKGHWLLVTLLLANVIVNETLPILADSIWGGGWPAIVISTTLIVIFGEVIPQAVCSRYGLAIGANLSWLVRFMMFIMSPIAWPIARMLDWALGETQGTTYRRAGLKALVSLHGNRPESSQSHAHVRTESIERLTEDEVTIIKAALDLREKTVGQIMTPLDDVFMVNWDQVLDYKVMHFILEKGYSRIPIYAGFSRRNIVGMLLVKKLITYDPHDALKVKEFIQAIQSIPVIDPDFKCLDLINIFQEGKSHMAVVVDLQNPVAPPSPTRTPARKGTNTSDVDLSPSIGANIEWDIPNMSVDPYNRPIPNVLGVVTLEDVIEELLGEEIIDETDEYIDVHAKTLVPRRRHFPIFGVATATAATATATLASPSNSGLPQLQNQSTRSSRYGPSTPRLGPTTPLMSPFHGYRTGNMSTDELGDGGDRLKHGTPRMVARRTKSSMVFGSGNHRRGSSLSHQSNYDSNVSSPNQSEVIDEPSDSINPAERSNSAASGGLLDGDSDDADGETEVDGEEKPLLSPRRGNETSADSSKKSTKRSASRNRNDNTRRK